MMTRAYPLIAAPRAGRRTAGRAAAAAVLASLLGGCYSVARAPEPVPEVPTDYRLRHPIVLQEGDRARELFIGTLRGGLTPAQRADVLAFAHGWKREATGGVVIEVPAGTANERAAQDSLHEIQSILAAAGVPPHGIYVQPYHPGDPARLATVKLKYPKIVAEAGPCGLWPSDIGPSVGNREYIENKPYWNLGCASQRNLAAMVADPADLVQPRGETPAYAGRRTTVLDKFRQGKSTAQESGTNDNKGKISDVGK
jgi:pilus assembly protein CpaD